MSNETTVGNVVSVDADTLQIKDAELVGDVMEKILNGTYSRSELQRFAKRENPFAFGKLSFKQRKAWEEFYRDEFGLTVDFSEVVIPDNSGGFDRVLVVAQGVTIEMVLEACRKYFKVWKYTDEDLDAFTKDHERTAANGHYAIRVRERVEADEELKGWSANQVALHHLTTMTLLERLIYELKYFKETRKHLDVSNVTLCAGSRYQDGYVPRVNWRSDGGRLYVDAYHPQDASDSLRARAVAVS
jgi:hypothetical protein